MVKSVALTPALSRRERGLLGVGGEFGVILILLTHPRHSRERGKPVTGGFASKLAPTKSKSAFALAFGLPEK